MATQPERLVLIGGGHAHVHVLDDLARAPVAGLDVVLVSPYGQQHYSGMVPGYLAGIYPEEALVFDLPRLCARAGARFVQACADRVDAAARRVHAGGEAIDFDLASLDVGSWPAGWDLPGVREHAVPARPMRRVVELRARVDEGAAGGGTVSVAVVGAGAAGVEIALALERRVRDRGATPRVTLLDASADRVLPGYEPRVRRRAASILARRGIAYRAGARVAAVEADGILLEDGTRIAADHTVWLAGAAAPPLVAASGLPRDESGYLLVDDTLRAADGSPVWGAGDCIRLAGRPPLPKAGVHAVRQSPVLAANLRAALTGASPVSYRPQSTFLSLLNTADGRALLRWHFVAVHAAWAFRLKDRIDRAFVRRYSG